MGQILPGSIAIWRREWKPTPDDVGGARGRNGPVLGGIVQCAKLFRGGAENVFTVANDDSPPPRLLSLLALIEGALAEDARPGAPLRSADFRKGIARMTFPADGGSVLVQNFQLADGQLCVRVKLARPGAVAWEGAIYPQVKGFDWSDAAARIALNWPVPTATPEYAGAASA